jgi:transcriptional regulator GlxA family with amidase domain
MKQVTILYPQEQSALSTVACVVGAVEVFTKAEDYWRKQGNPQKYKVVIAGTSSKEEFIKGMVAIKTDFHFSEITTTDLIIIPAATPVVNSSNRAMLDWINKQYKKGSEIASMCSGAFILGSSGVLDGKRCSTHWSLTDWFREMFPKVNLCADKLITDEYGIYTNGGAYSFLNLMIYLIEKFYDRQTAIYCSKVLQIELDRNSQSEFSIFTGHKLHGDELVQEAQKYMESNAEEKLSIEEISSKFAIGRRSFDRRFIKATGVTPLEYTQRVKIELAKKALESSRKNVNEVMYEVGYADVKAFREVFRKFTGMSPLEYRGKYNKDAMV